MKDVGSKLWSGTPLNPFQKQNCASAKQQPKQGAHLAFYKDPLCDHHCYVERVVRAPLTHHV